MGKSEATSGKGAEKASPGCILNPLIVSKTACALNRTLPYLAGVSCSWVTMLMREDVPVLGSEVTKVKSGAVSQMGSSKKSMAYMVSSVSTAIEKLLSAR